MTAADAWAEMPEAELLARLRQGDTQAIRHIVTANNQRLFRAAWAVLRDRGEAEDAVQSAYLKAFAGIDGFAGRSGLSTWLTRIVINEARARRRSVRRLRSERDAAEARHQTAPTAPAPTPEQLLLQKETQQLVELAIGRLPDYCRPVFILRVVEGMSVEDVATALDILPATVKTRLFRARRLLQADLEAMATALPGGLLSFGGDTCQQLTARIMARLSGGNLVGRDRSTPGG